MKRRCGVGLDISPLRPEGENVNNAAKTSTGAISFMERFSETTREVAQSGRRGALMLSMDGRHPNVDSFATIKNDDTKVTGANISIKLMDDFMRAVENDGEYKLQWPVESSDPTVTRTVKAKELWETIISSAHLRAEPGLIFWDRQHFYSTSSLYPQYKNISTNPCAEIAMGNDSCRLMALVLFGFIDNPFTNRARFNYDKFYEYVYESQRLMDDVVELELEHVKRIIEKIKSDPEPDHIKQVEIATWERLYESGKNGRRTGLGFTALADTLAALGIKFDSKKALKVTDEIMRVKLKAEWDSSIDMAIERGQFVGFDKEIEDQSEFIHMVKKEFPEIYARNMEYGRRNISISTLAPCGSVSIEAQTSSGGEALFALKFGRRRKVNPNDEEVRVDFVDEQGDSWMYFEVEHERLKQWSEVTGNKNYDESPYFGCTAHDIDWNYRVKLQGVIQKYTTHSVSSTINLPNDVSLEEVSDIYMASWKEGLKGITIYRDGCRSGVLILSETDDDGRPVNIVSSQAPKRPEFLPCDIHVTNIKGVKWVFLIGMLNERPYEVFGGKFDDIIIPAKYIGGRTDPNVKWKATDLTAAIFKNDGHYDLNLSDPKKVVNDHSESTLIEDIASHFSVDLGTPTRLISMLLRHGVSINNICEQIKKIPQEDTMLTFEKGVGRVLKKYIDDNTKAKGTCPECERHLIYEGGCVKCSSCHWSKCE